MASTETIETAAGLLNAVFTERHDGDFAVGAEPTGLADRRRRIIDAPWTWFHQVHGPDVVEVDRPGQHAGSDADGGVTTATGAPVAIMTADCAPVVLVAERGFAVLHAGWRGLVDGVVERAAHRLAGVAGAPVASLIGPCISPGAYEFGAVDLARAVDVFGDAVRSSTDWGTPALDVPAAVDIALDRAGWPPPVARPPCTSDERFFSHRTRTDAGRQATVAWLGSPDRFGGQR